MYPRVSFLFRKRVLRSNYSIDTTTHLWFFHGNQMRILVYEAREMGWVSLISLFYKQLCIFICFVDLYTYCLSVQNSGYFGESFEKNSMLKSIHEIKPWGEISYMYPSSIQIRKMHYSDNLFYYKNKTIVFIIAKLLIRMVQQQICMLCIRIWFFPFCY